MKVNPTEPIDVAIVVKKQSGTGIFKNERLLLIKSGFVSYFSRIPKHYVGNCLFYARKCTFTLAIGRTSKDDSVCN